MARKNRGVIKSHIRGVVVAGLDDRIESMEYIAEVEDFVDVDTGATKKRRTGRYTVKFTIREPKK